MRFQNYSFLLYAYMLAGNVKIQTSQLAISSTKTINHALDPALFDAAKKGNTAKVAALLAGNKQYEIPDINAFDNRRIHATGQSNRKLSSRCIVQQLVNAKANLTLKIHDLPPINLAINTAAIALPRHADTKNPNDLQFITKAKASIATLIEAGADVNTPSEAGSDLFKQQYNLEQRPSLYFWRDHTGNELDCIVDTGGQPVPIEIKAGKTVSTDFFKNFTYWQRTTEIESERRYLIYGDDEDRSLP